MSKNTKIFAAVGVAVIAAALVWNFVFLAKPVAPATQSRAATGR